MRVSSSTMSSRMSVTGSKALRMIDARLKAEHDDCNHALLHHVVGCFSAG